MGKFICENCGKEFESFEPTSKFCSKKCYKQKMHPKYKYNVLNVVK